MRGEAGESSEGAAGMEVRVLAELLVMRRWRIEERRPF